MVMTMTCNHHHKQWQAEWIAGANEDHGRTRLTSRGMAAVGVHMDHHHTLLGRHAPTMMVAATVPVPSCY